ncbi:glycine oxidase maturase GoxB [bacterium]|nr:glycine oxidase maturase GoxB [bacterium]
MENRIVVVGGGIAGAAACLRLVDAGLQPLWVAPNESGQRKHGEHLSPAACTLLQEVGVLELLDRPYHREANVMYSAWGSDQLAERDSIVHLEGPGTVLDREAFERDLAAEVGKRGVERREVPLKEVHRNGKQWELTFDDEGAGEQMSADYLIDASGRHAVIAKGQAPRFRSDKLVAVIAYMEQRADSDVEPTRATLIEAVSDGWWYATLLADQRLALNYYTDPDLLPEEISRETEVIEHLLGQTHYISRWIDEAGFEFTSSPYLASAGTTWIAPAGGEGWVAVGDAAASFDPLSSHGMTAALWTAITGADAAIAYLSGDSGPSITYTQKVAAGIQDFLDKRTVIYGQETRFENSAFWMRRRP